MQRDLNCQPFSHRTPCSLLSYKPLTFSHFMWHFTFTSITASPSPRGAESIHGCYEVKAESQSRHNTSWSRGKDKNLTFILDNFILVTSSEPTQTQRERAETTLTHTERPLSSEVNWPPCCDVVPRSPVHLCEALCLSRSKQLLCVLFAHAACHNTSCKTNSSFLVSLPELVFVHKLWGAEGLLEMD